MKITELWKPKLNPSPRVWYVTTDRPVKDARDLAVASDRWNVSEYPLIDAGHDPWFGAHSNNDYMYEITMSADPVTAMDFYEKVMGEEIGYSFMGFDYRESKKYYEAVYEKNIPGVWYDTKWKKANWITMCRINPNFVKSFKVIHSKSEFDVSEYPSKRSGSPSDQAVTWLKKFMGSNGHGKPPAAVARELSEYVPESPVTLLRGMGWYPSEIWKLSGAKYPMRRGESVTVNYKKPSSWTTNEIVAENFAESTGPLWVVIEATVNPADVLVDTRLLPDNVLSKLYIANQREVILKPGAVVGSVRQVGERKDYEWSDYSVSELSALRDATVNLAKKLQSEVTRGNKKWVAETPRQHYNGALGVSFPKFNEKNCYVVSFNIRDKIWSVDFWSKGYVKKVKTINTGGTVESAIEWANSEEAVRALSPYGQ